MFAAPSAQKVTLPTGDSVTVSTVNGRASYSVTGPKGAATAYVSYQDATGDHFIIPDEARPYLGRQLDASLFDVSALLRAGSGAGAQIPVSLFFPAGTSPSAPPGVTLTSSSGSSATGTVETGYLTSSSGAAFAAGLRSAIGADVAAGRHAGAGALFGGLASMGLAAPGSVLGSGASGAVSPRFPLHILQINATDLTGAPSDNSLAFLLNVDAVAREQGFVPIAGGLARIAVPAGNYSMVVQYADFDTSGNLTAIRNVVVDDFSVSATATTSTVAADERTATVPFSVTTPRPATPDAMQISWIRQDAAGATSTFGSIIFGGGITLYSNSQPAPAVGALHYVVQWDGAGPATGEQYRFDVAYGTSDIPANQTHVLRPRDLATVHHIFYTDPASPTGGAFLNGTYDGVGLSEVGGGESYAGPVTQYLGTGDGGRWVSVFATSNGIQYLGDVENVVAGHEYRVEWAHGPLAPNFGRHTGPQVFFPCLACASGSALMIAVNMVGDSEPDHVGLPFFGGTSHFTLYQNGTVVADQDGAFGTELTGVPVAPTTYRLVYDTDNTGVSGLSQSLATHTDVTFRYVPGADPGDTLPTSYGCDFNGSVTHPCQVLPVLNLDYHLSTDASNTSGSAVQAMQLDVGHLTYDGQGSHAPITSATVSVSFDGGKTWTHAVVGGAFGHYVAFWRNPASAAGTSPELRVTAADAFGGSVTQTITSAYTIAASVH